MWRSDFEGLYGNGRCVDSKILCTLYELLYGLYTLILVGWMDKSVSQPSSVCIYLSIKIYISLTIYVKIN